LAPDKKAFGAFSVHFYVVTLENAAKAKRN